MRLFNQTKNALSWSMGGVTYSCQPWGPVSVPDDLVGAVRSRGLPLGMAPVERETRAKVLIADEEAQARDAPLIQLRKQLEDAQDKAKAAEQELERMSAELSAVRDELRTEKAQVAELQEQALALKADKESAEALMSEQAQKAVEADAARIKAEAQVAEAPKASGNRKAQQSRPAQE